MYDMVRNTSTKINGSNRILSFKKKSNRILMHLAFV